MADKTKAIDFNLSCPAPFHDESKVLLGHGSGGKLMHDLLSKVFSPAFSNPYLDQQHDGAVIRMGDERFAFTTDSYVVKPIFFPGGNIGSLAVYGTVNDLAMCGARPLYLSTGVILEEGFSMESLRAIVASMREAAQRCGVLIVTGDTKVVDKGKGDGIFINVSGVGIFDHDQEILPKHVKAGDEVILSGDIGRHGITLMAQREGLEFESPLTSDSAPLHEMVSDLLRQCPGVHCLRDLTRGGLAAGVVEIAQSSKLEITIDETSVPVHGGVRGACEILGLDPFLVANEGRFIVFVDENQAENAVKILRKYSDGASACRIGKVQSGIPGRVRVTSAMGTNRLLDLPSGDPLPRIC